jgi:hypothetical protein
VGGDGSREDGGTEGEAPLLLYREAGGGDGSHGVAIGMASSSEEGPEDVCPVLEASSLRRVGADVLVEAELPTGAQDAAELGEGPWGARHRAQHERGNGGVEAGVLCR